jgi:hypothetical protein
MHDLCTVRHVPQDVYMTPCRQRMTVVIFEVGLTSRLRRLEYMHVCTQFAGVSVHEDPHHSARATSSSSMNSANSSGPTTMDPSTGR